MKRISLSAGGFLLLLVSAAPVDAYSLPTMGSCNGLFGCGSLPDNLPLQLAKSLGPVLLGIAGALAVLFITLAGFQMVLNMGDEGKISQYKRGIANAMIGLAVAILADFFVTAASTFYTGLPTAIVDPITFIQASVFILRTLLNALFLVIVVIAGARMAYAQGKSDEYNKAKTMLLWAAIGAVIVNLAASLAAAVSGELGT